MRTDRVDVGEVTLAVTQHGDGPAVLLLHGFPDCAQLWRHQIPALAAAGYRVIAPDLRGFGASDRPPGVEAYRMRHLVADVCGLLDALDVDRAAVVGHDWGAALAWATAMSRPDRVSRLAALSVGHPGTRAVAGDDQRRLSWYMLWFLLPGVAEAVMPLDDWRFLRDWGWAGSPGGEDEQRQIDGLARPGALVAALNWYRANIDPRRFVGDTSGLPAVSCPTMGIWSSDDPFLAETQMTASADFVDASWRYERVDGVDHWLPVRAPRRVTDLLLGFLAPELSGSS